MSEAKQPEPGQTIPPPKRVPIRRRPMPCPHCDAELYSAGLSGEPEPNCPHCGLPLRAVEVAGVLRRTAAALVDSAILLVTAGPIAWGLYRLSDPLPIAPGAKGLDLLLSLGTADFGLLLARIGPFLLLCSVYFLVSVFLLGRTFGHRLLKIRVVDRHGQPPGLLVSVVRTAAQLLGTLAAAFGPLWVAFDSERRAMHDVVAGTYVVRST